MTSNILYAGIIFVHSWYPLSCCSERDCHPVVGSVIENRDGSYTAEGINFPKELVKPSQDGDYHVCYVPETKRPLCFFIPLAA